MRTHIALTALFLFSLPTLSQAVVRYVDPAGSDTNSGLSWPLAKKTIGSAITSASSGDEIWLVKGTYSEQVTIKPGVSLYGGFLGTETLRSQRDPSLNVTRIDGSGHNDAVIASLATAITTLDGVSVMNGGARGIYGSTSLIRLTNVVVEGNPTAGVYLIGAAPVISGCKVTGNGVGIQLVNTTGATIENCSIDSNANAGVAAENANFLLRSSFLRQNAYSGLRALGGTSIIRGNFFGHNQSAGAGGGAYVAGGSSTIENNTFHGNRSDVPGGGLGLGSCKATVRSNLFSWNSAIEGGGMFFTCFEPVTITNNTFVFNAPVDRTTAGGLAMLGPDAGQKTYIVANNLFAFNFGGFGKRFTSVTPTLSRNLFWKNESFDTRDLPFDATAVYGDPKLLSDYFGDYHIGSAGAAANAGSNTYAPAGTKDIDGENRTNGGAVDIGADEYHSDRIITPSRKVIFVRAAGNDAFSGTGWPQALKTIEEANRRAGPGDRIWMTGETFNLSGPIVPQHGVQFFGGFAGGETSETQRDPVRPRSLMNGLLDKYAVEFFNSTPLNIVDSVDIVSSGQIAVRNQDGSPTFNNCIFRGATGAGFSSENGWPRLTSCVVRDNGGPGLSFYTDKPELESVKVINNQGGGIAANYSLGFWLNVTIENNQRANFGGGIYMENSAPTIANCIIRGNTATSIVGQGGGIYLNNSDPTISSSVIAGNLGDLVGGIKITTSSSPVIRNCTIVDNKAASGSQTGGIDAENASSPTIANNIIAFNSGRGVNKTGGTGEPKLFANCLFGNTGINYGNVSPGAGDILVDPLLRNFANRDYRIKFTSPCVNAGDQGYFFSGEKDYYGWGRWYGVNIDIGAHEATPSGYFDVNLDRKWDGLVTDPQTGSMAILRLTWPFIAGSFSLTPVPGPDWRVVTMGNLTGDGSNQILVQNDTTGQLSFLRQSGAKVVSSTPIQPPLPSPWYMKGITSGFFNEVAQPDNLIAQNQSTGRISILRIEDNRITFSIPISVSPPLGWEVKTAVDVDDNGSDDIIVQNGNRVAVLYTDGPKVIASRSVFPYLAPGWQIVGKTDTNGDAQSELVAQNLSTRQISALRILNDRWVSSIPLNPQLPAGKVWAAGK